MKRKYQKLKNKGWTKNVKIQNHAEGTGKHTMWKVTKPNADQT